MTTPKDPGNLIPAERLDHAILEIRGRKVVLSHDLAALYGVSTKAFNQAVKRNADRFPPDFMFQLTQEEAQALRSQIVTLKRGSNIKYLPYAFSEHGAVMAATILNSPRAVEVSVFVVRAFVRLNRVAADQRRFALKLAEIEAKLATQNRSPSGLCHHQTAHAAAHAKEETHRLCHRRRQTRPDRLRFGLHRSRSPSPQAPQPLTVRRPFRHCNLGTGHWSLAASGRVNLQSTIWNRKRVARLSEPGQLVEGNALAVPRVRKRLRSHPSLAMACSV